MFKHFVGTVRLLEMLNIFHKLLTVQIWTFLFSGGAEKQTTEEHFAKVHDLWYL